MPITLEVRECVAEIVFDHPPVNAFDCATAGRLRTDVPVVSESRITSKKKNVTAGGGEAPLSNALLTPSTPELAALPLSIVLVL
jgi:hypothetical protein